MSSQSPKVEPVKRDVYPAGIPFIVGNEGAERFSFYGMKTILKVYLTALFLAQLMPADKAAEVGKGYATATQAIAKYDREGKLGELGIGKEQYGEVVSKTTEVYHLFVAGVYFFPLLGAVLADRLWGKYKVIFWVSLIYCLGHGVLAVAGRFDAAGKFDTASLGMMLGLGLIALGSGGIKPCVSANVGDQFTQENGHLVTRVFQIFYFIINFGSFFSTLLTPLLFAFVGPEVAFGVPGVLMAIATLFFWMGRRKFIHKSAEPGGRLGAFDALSTTLMFSPFFGLIYGYFVMWTQFVTRHTMDVAGKVIAGPALFVGGPKVDIGYGIGVSASFGDIVGPALAYYLPLLVIVALSFVIGFVLFTLRQKIKQDDGFLAVLVYSFKNRKNRQAGDSFFDPARKHFGQDAGDGPPAVLNVVLLVFAMISFFWALFDQHGSTWVDQAKQMNLMLVMPKNLFYGMIAGTLVLALYGGTWLLMHVSNRDVPRKYSVAFIGAVVVALIVAAIVDALGGGMKSVELKPSQIAALNPLMVMVIIPLLNVALWNPLKNRGINVTPLQKMTIGMFLAVAGFAIAALLQQRIEAAGHGQIHVLWQSIQYFVMTTSEVLVSITGLEFAYTQAPRRMKSTLMGFFLFTVAAGNLIVAFLSPLQKSYQLSEFFWLFAGLMAGAAVLFSIMAYFYRGKTYLQEA
ncbi:MAG: hypothetical protein H6707_21665 [Deltaproteobacteria bacterium]|nr:hypothetical protein [Deltaproteobacteria bacterium]